MGWWARQDLNLGPTDYESAALTAELRARLSEISYIERAQPRSTPLGKIVREWEALTAPYALRSATCKETLTSLARMDYASVLDW